MKLNTTSVYVIWKGHLLLILRSRSDSNKPLWWEAPAGHVDVDCPRGDSLIARSEALRELKEETGIQAKSSQLTHLPKYSNNLHSSYLLVAISNLPPKVTLSFEHEKFKWISLCKAKLCSPLRKEVKRFAKDMCNVKK